MTAEFLEFFFIFQTFSRHSETVGVMLFSVISLSQNSSLCDSPFRCSDAEARAVLQAVSVCPFFFFFIFTKFSFFLKKILDSILML